MENPTPQLPPGWQLDAEGHLRRATLHRMARRCLRWDYRAPAYRGRIPGGIDVLAAEAVAP